MVKSILHATDFVLNQESSGPQSLLIACLVYPPHLPRHFHRETPLPAPGSAVFQVLLRRCRHLHHHLSLVFLLFHLYFLTVPLPALHHPKDFLHQKDFVVGKIERGRAIEHGKDDCAEMREGSMTEQMRRSFAMERNGDTEGR